MTPIEEAQVRVAKAQEEKDKLAAEVTRKFGALRDLDVMCQHHNDPHNKNSELRRKYNQAVKELRLAKSDLARMRNEEGQKVEVEASGDGILIKNVPEDLKPELASGGTGKVVEVLPNGDAVLELTPSKKTALEVMEENAQKAETKKATRQVDLNGNPLKLPEGVKETRKVSKSRLYEEERFKLRISEDNLYDFAGLWSEHQREIVAAKLRPKKGVIPARGELDDEIDHMIKVLVIASMNFKQERILEEARAKALAQVI